MKKRSLIIALSISLSIGLAVVIPELRDRQNAVGSLSQLSPKLKRTFTETKEFSPLPQPQNGDWLTAHKEPGQTYQQFLRSRPNQPGANGRKFIYLQPLGDFPKDAPSMATLREYMECYFYPMPVKISQTLKVTPGKKIAMRENSGVTQWNCIHLLNALQKRVPHDAYIVMGVTMTDLYPDDDWNFVFGMARIKKRVGVFSFARYGRDPALVLKRAMKVISHETGHAFGIKHCVHYHCLMNGSNSMEETDRAPLHFCPVCLRKIHWGLKFDPVERYQKLADFLTAEQMEDESQWYKKRIEVISGK